MAKSRARFLPLLLAAACATADPETVSEDLAVVPMPSAPLAEDARLTRIAFGSCLKQNEPMPVLAAMTRRDPDLAVLLGDNVYGDVEDVSDPNMPELREAYRALAGRREFTELRRRVPLLTVWDDHDYGLNDAGGAFARKEEAERIFEDAWALAADDPRRQRPGIYTAKTFGPEGQRVQIVLLDTRFFRDALLATDEKGVRGKERYIPRPGPETQMLGAAQEAWLAETLAEPAELRIIVSSVQVIADGHGWEAWKQLPGARERLWGILGGTQGGRTVLVSGDRHLGGLYARRVGPGEAQVEMTASSLNAPASAWRDEDGAVVHEAGPHRLGPPVYQENFGEVEIDWEAGEVSLVLRNMDGAPLRALTLPLDGALQRKDITVSR